jgi:hypothetical protein
VREHVEQHFGIGIGVDVAAVVIDDLAAQRVRVDEIAVVRERDAVRRVDVERLRLGRAFRTCGWIAAVADADVAAKAEHRLAREHVADEAGAFVQSQAIAVDRRDAGGVLAPVLEHGQRVVERRSDFRFSDDADDSAHGLRLTQTTVSIPAPVSPGPPARRA